MKKIKYIVSLSLIFIGLALCITGGILIHASDSAVSDITTQKSETFSECENLKNISITSKLPANVIITSGENLSVNCSGIFEENLEYTFDGETFKLEYDSKNKLERFKINVILGVSSYKKMITTITVTIPTGCNLNEVIITNGVGELNATDISAESLTLVSGVGESTLRNCAVSEKAVITNGVGEFNCKSSDLNNLKLKNGVGEILLKNNHLSGESTIENGVGEIFMQIVGSRSEYNISVENGIGEVNIDGGKSDVQGGVTLGSIDISNGIGKVEIDFTNN